MSDVLKPYQLDHLGQMLIDEIKNRNNPFQKVIIVVPHNKVAQWFKAYWLKNESSVLMNVRFETINNILAEFIDTSIKYQMLSKEEFRTLIINTLSKEYRNGVYQEIKDYLVNDNKLDPIKLFDLSNQLASLFMEYEEDQIEITSWQGTLYKSIMETAQNINYSTISYLFKKHNLKTTDSLIYFLGFIKFNKLQEDFIEKLSQNNFVVTYKLERNNSYQKEVELVKAPSILREIEVLHSTICNLINDYDYNDFLVVSPNLSQYENAIERVFKQVDDKYPNIPYVINTKRIVETNLSNGIKKLMEIHSKGFFTRLDFFTLINNQDISSSRQITKEDIEHWTNYIVDTNVYRNGKSHNDWDYAKKRLALSKVVDIADFDDNLVELTSGDYIPFSRIGFNDESISRFISVIDDLNSWIDVTSNTNYLTKDNINVILKELDKWFSIKDQNGFETNNYYKNIIFDLNFLRKLDLKENLIPLNTLFYQLEDVSKNTKSTRGEYFLKGITFTEFDEVAVLPAKHVFFLNASSTDLPKTIVQSELDERKDKVLDSKALEDAFFIQYQNALEKLHISFVNKDLKNDEKLYPSSFVVKLCKNTSVKEIEVSLDEKRDWDQLFTKSASENKKYYAGLLKEEPKKEEPNESLEFDVPTKVKLKNLADFLEEPFMYKAKALFGSDYSNDEQMRDEFEPIVINALTSYNLVKTISIKALKEDLEMIESDFDDVKRKFMLENELPNLNNTLIDLNFNKAFNLSKDLVEHIRKHSTSTKQMKKLDDAVLNTKYGNITLTCSDECYVSINGNERTYFQIKKLPKNADKNKERNFVYSYVYALMDIMNLNTEEEYEITLNSLGTRTFQMTSSKAKDLLTKIFLASINYHENYYLPLEKFYTGKYKTLYEMVQDIVAENGSVWGFFEDKKLFNYYSDLGYTFENFKDVYHKKRNEHIELITYLDPIKNEGDENGNN